MDAKIEVKFDEKGLVPAVLQDAASGAVLMVAYMNQEALEQTIKTKKATFYSRSRQSLWVKGETSGNFQEVEEILCDCDADCLLVKVKSCGPACHTGHTSCFYRDLNGNEKLQNSGGAAILDEVFNVICDRAQNPSEESYTNYLLDCGIDKILKKVGEECSETIIAAKNEDKSEIAMETADLLYHLLVMLKDCAMSPDDVYAELKKRHQG